MSRQMKEETRTDSVPMSERRLNTPGQNHDGAPRLPPEILDHIVDYLRDEPTTPKTCCVVSKSWIHRTRKYLFAHVEFYAPESRIGLWRKTFPDPSNSPTHHTRSLSVRGLLFVTVVDEDVDNWICPFKHLVHLHLECLGWDDYRVPLAPFHGLSPTRGSRVGFSPPRRWCIEHSFDLAQAHCIPRPEGPPRYPPCRTSIVGPPGWSPLLQDHSSVLHRRSRAGNGFGVGMFRHPQISRRFL